MQDLIGCDHGAYIPVNEAMALVKDNKSEICWTSSIVEVCEKCGENIKHLRLVETMTVAEYMRKL